MSEQDNTQASTKRSRSRSTRKQIGTKAPALTRPTKDDREAWKAYWKSQGQPWRTEPEIDSERQKYLAGRRAITPDIKQGIYPFKDIKLSRADVEWLLATHENSGMREPVDWSDEHQREREGLDFRGADLRNENLSSLPLGGSNFRSDLIDTHLEGANLSSAHLEGSNFQSAHLEGARLFFAHLEEASLYEAHLEEARLNLAHLEGAMLIGARLEGAKLFNTFLDRGTRLDSIILSNKKFGEVTLLDVHWGDVNVAVVDWSSISILGDERKAQQLEKGNGRHKNRQDHIKDYGEAVRAYRQLAIVLRAQGLNEDASHFAYRAQLMQRKVFWYQRKIWQHLFSFFLDLLAGYGYKAWRSFIAYLIVIAAFATVYFIIGQKVGPALSPLGSWVFSMTSFHGRGFFPGGIKLDDPLTVLAALEAFIGLLIEVTFIATLTQRLFGK